MSKGFNYSKWDKIELSDDEDDVHPNIDKDSWFRLKHRTRVENEEDDGKKRVGLEAKLKKIREELKTFGDSGQGHAKAVKLRSEADALEQQLAKMEKDKKWNADNMCKTTENQTTVSAKTETPKPEPRLQGEAMSDGYCEFVEKHVALLEEYIALGAEDDFEVVQRFLQEHGGLLLQGEHAESYLLLDCLEKEMNDEHDEMLKSARQNQFLTQLREFSRAARRPVRDAVFPVFQKLLNHEETRQSFDDAVASFSARIVKRAPEKKKEMDAELAEHEKNECQNDPGPGGLDPMEVLHTLPKAMQEAFRAQDMQRLHHAVESLDPADAKYHLERCEASGLWVPNPDAGAPPYKG